MQSYATYNYQDKYCLTKLSLYFYSIHQDSLDINIHRIAES